MKIPLNTIKKKYDADDSSTSYHSTVIWPNKLK